MHEKHFDICSGSRTRRNREEAIRRKKAKEGEAKGVKATGGGKAMTGTTTDALGHLPQREVTETPKTYSWLVNGHTW
jgi:hypothetical protein